MTQSSARPSVAVLDYEIGNLRSAQKALIRAGANASLTNDAEEVANADGVVLPGVGAFGACMDALDDTGIGAMAIEAASSGRPFLGICVGMQLLYEGSEETPGRVGLGILPGVIQSLANMAGDLTVPQMQWNRLEISQPGHPLLADLDGQWMYFVHSYIAPPSQHVIATTNYPCPIPAVVAKDNVWATQFHPEKSAKAGGQLLQNWVRAIS